MNMKEYKIVQALKAKGMRQDRAVKAVLDARKNPNDFKARIGKRG